MQQTNQNPNVEQTFRTLVIIWFALLNSQLLLLVVLYFAKPKFFAFDFSKPLLGENALFIIIIGIAGISNFIISLLLRKKFVDRAIAEQNVGLVQTAMIIGCALSESISLFGLVLAFARNYQYFFLWFALGVLGIILHFPRRENLIAASYKR
jgi:F0F1-type ATP synthase membrane subunit c/vacuolar-type H+-ATPase subunit K